MLFKPIRWIKEKFSSNNNSEALAKVDINKLEGLLGLRIKNPIYFIKALTHRSFLEIAPELEKSNERLEFLGDSVLGVIVAESLFKHFPGKDEGFLTKYRSHLVDRVALANAANNIHLMSYVLFDKRYVRGSIAGQKTIVADCFEALIGAIYLDAGLEEARKFVAKHILEPNYNSGAFRIDKNFKGQLLELTHYQKLSQPFYNILNEEGPDHDKKFHIEVSIDGESYGIGIGANKKSAEQQAAKFALAKISQKNRSNSEV